MHALIETAIKEKKHIEIHYDGGLRTIEPHCHGVTTAGNPGLRAYQISGHSIAGEKLGWKLFDLSKAVNVKLLDSSFSAPREGYRKGDRGMQKIHSEL